MPVRIGAEFVVSGGVVLLFVTEMIVNAKLFEGTGSGVLLIASASFVNVSAAMAAA